MHLYVATCLAILRYKTFNLCSIQVIPFPLFELQSKWVAWVLSGRIVLPSKEEMMEDVKAFYSKLEARGWPKRYTHNLFKLPGILEMSVNNEIWRWWKHWWAVLMHRKRKKLCVMASVLCHIDIPMLIHLNHVNLLSHFSFMTLPIADAKLGPTHGRVSKTRANTRTH